MNPERLFEHGLAILYPGENLTFASKIETWIFALRLKSDTVAVDA